MKSIKQLPITFLIFISYSVFPMKLSGQDLNETIVYINNILKTNSALFRIGGVVGGHGPIKSFDKISIDIHGKINIYTYELDENADSIIKKDSQCYGYLKSLLVKKGADFIEPNYSVCRLILFCGDSKSNCMICESGIMPESIILINDKDARDRLQNAFSHLINLAKSDSKYYDHDPFGN